MKPDSPNQSKPDSSKPDSAKVQVTVRGPGRARVPEYAAVTLTRNGEAIQLEASYETLIYAGSVAPGDYRLNVSVETLGLVAPPRMVTIPAEGKDLSAYLGKPDWPYYPYGEDLIPFEPRKEVAVCFELAAPPRNAIAPLLRQITTELRLAPMSHSPDDEFSFMAAHGSIWLFQPTDDSIGNDHPGSFERLRAILSEWNPRVGMPVDLSLGQVRVLDARFVVRFSESNESAGLAMADSAGAKVLRSFGQSPNTWLIEFQKSTFRDQLRIVHEWIRGKAVLWAEPDLMAELSYAAFPPTPNDPQYKNQPNLTDQNVPGAWALLKAIHVDLTLGSPNVHVAMLDLGIDPGHPDIGGLLTDGSQQLALSHDFIPIQNLNHGMGVYGIIAARTNNKKGIAGIAPNTHQIAVTIVLFSSAYQDVLLWAAGILTNLPPGFPAQPAPGADIINCSHEIDQVAGGNLIDATMDALGANGRGGKGTLVIYAAGNTVGSGNKVDGFTHVHPNTMVISNAAVSGTGEGLWMGSPGNPPSNFGPCIDICARGEGVTSLARNGKVQEFAGTSAAAPTVAAAAALMLSKNPLLTATQVRNKLRQTAVKIDPANPDPYGKWVGNFSKWYGYGRLDVEAAVNAA